MSIYAEVILSICAALFCVALGLYTFAGWLVIFYWLGIASLPATIFACVAVIGVMAGGALAIHKLFELFDELDY